MREKNVMYRGCDFLFFIIDLFSVEVDFESWNENVVILCYENEKKEKKEMLIYCLTGVL